MNDLLNDNTNPKNIEELFEKILKTVTHYYDILVPENVKYRKNYDKANMNDCEIISVQILIECIKKSQSAGYNFLKSNFPNLVNYIERSRFNRKVRNLMTVIKAIREEINKNNQKEKYKIIDSFPLPVIKFGRAHFGKRLREYSTYGYCASKKETYFGMKVHVVTTLDGNPINYLLTPANIDDRDAVFELSDLVSMDTLLADKGYDGKLHDELMCKKGINLLALQKKTSKNPLPKPLRNWISKARRRIETTFQQLNELFNIEKVYSNSLLGVITNLEIKFLSYNILAMIAGNTQIAHIINFN